MLCLYYHAEVEQLCFLLGVLLVGAKYTKEVLRRSYIVVRFVKVKALSEICAAVHCVRVSRDYRKLCDYLDTLAQHIVQRGVVGVLII